MKKELTTEVEIITPSELRRRLTMIPATMEAVVWEAEQSHSFIEYEFLSTPFGRYPMAARMIPRASSERGGL